MGEYADDAFDDYLDNLGRGYYDDEDFILRKTRYKKQVKTCMYCGEGNLQWEQTVDDAWRLHDTKGRLHNCWLFKQPPNSGMFKLKELSSRCKRCDREDCSGYC